MREPVFDNLTRENPIPKKHSESTFEFLNRIEGDFWYQPRDLIQSWMNNIEKDEDYRDLRSRLRSKDDEQHRSAFFELYLHESFLRAGYQVVIHPELQESVNHPDFLVIGDDEKFYVEAKVPAISKESKAQGRRLGRFYDVINSCDNHTFLLSAQVASVGSADAHASKLRKALNRWLAGLNPDDEFRFETAPTYSWEDEGWSAEFKAIPIAEDKRGDYWDRRAIGVTMHEPAWIDNAPKIKDALKSKQSRYGDLDAPFVIAIATYDFSDEDYHHSANALLGTSVIRLDENVNPHYARNPDGYFGAPWDWQNTQVSGVLICNQLSPEGIQFGKSTLWYHPAAEFDLPEKLGLPVDVHKVVDLNLVQEPFVKNVAEFFGLHPDFPVGASFPK